MITASSSKRTFKTVLNFSVLLVLVTMLWSCSSQPDESDQEARQIVNEYLRAIKDEQIETAVSYYPEEARDQWRDFIVKAQQDKGALQKIETEGVEANTVYSGKFFLVFIHTYNEKRNAREVITVLKKLTDDKPYIVSHKIKLDRLPDNV